MPSRVAIAILVCGMLVTGVCNTLLTKYQDNQCVHNCDDPNPKRREYFEQPVIQTLQMFIGESGCWLVVGCYSLYKKYYGNRASYQALNTTEDHAEDEVDRDEVDGVDEQDPAANNESTTANTPAVSAAAKPLVKNAEDRIPLVGSRVLLLALPAICDICGTTLMNVGLLFVVASIYQMTRGALVLFVGLFSVVFLHRHLRLVQWISLITVVVGVALVGLAGAIYKEHKVHDSTATATVTSVQALGETMSVISRRAVDAAGPDAVRTVLGVLLIAFAQIFTASQFVLEEFILEKYALEPIKVVGWEGIFGFLVTVVGMFILHFAVGRTDAGRGGYFDATEGLRQTFSNTAVWVSSLLIMISIGGFNFFGLSVTRSISATSRSLIDTCRTMFIWIVSLMLGWESFKWLQLVGFALLVYGTFLFNGLVQLPPIPFVKKRDESQPPSSYEQLLPEEPVEHV